MTRSGRVQSAFDIPCNRLLKMTGTTADQGVMILENHS